MAKSFKIGELNEVEGYDEFVADLKAKSQKRFDNFITELNDESDRGAAIFSSTFFENQLRTILSETLRKTKSTEQLLDEASGGLNTFSSRINICYSLGYITNYELSELNLVKKIRNKFAHNFDYKFLFTDKSVESICKSFKAKLPDGKILKDMKPRELFINAVIKLHARLIDRHYELITYLPPEFDISKYTNTLDGFVIIS